MKGCRVGVGVGCGIWVLESATFRTRAGRKNLDKQQIVTSIVARVVESSDILHLVI